MLQTLGLSSAADDVYRLMLSSPQLGVAELCAQLTMSETDVRASLDELVRYSLVRESRDRPGRLRAVSPEVGLAALLQRQEEDLARRRHELAVSRTAISETLADYADLAPDMSGDGIQRLIGLDAIQTQLEILARELEHECLSVMPGGAQSAGSLETSRPLDEAALARGVSLLTLYQDSVRADPATYSYACWLTELGGQVRTAPVLPPRMLIFDRRVAVLPIDPAETRRGALCLREPGIVAAVAVMYEHTWDTAVPLGTGITHDEETGLTPVDRELLRLLSTGMTDEAAGRRVGLSQRTVRRRIASVMECLHATSRFEAGVRAAQRGWILSQRNGVRMRKLEPTYAQFHEQSCPVDWTKYGGGSWFVAGYQELRDAARDDVTFSSRHDLEDGSSPFYGVMVPPLPVRGIPIELERQECQSFRRVVSGHFSAAAVDRLLPAITEVVDDAIDARIESGSIDLFHDLAKIVPASILLRILGLTASDVLVIADTVHRRGPDRFTVGDGWDVLRARVCEVLAARRNQPQDDLISTLARFDGPEGPLDDESIIGACFLFVVAGMSTTAKLALGALGYLGTHPAARRLLTERPDMISPAIEEFLRYYSPVPALSRTAATDTELGGVKISTGDRLTLGYGAANRDPAVFDRPNEVVLDRSPNPHVAMGHGLHYCIGARLGKAEATVMVTRALTRLGDFQVIPGQRHMGKLTVRPVSLKASFTPGPRSKPSGVAPAA